MVEVLHYSPSLPQDASLVLSPSSRVYTQPRMMTREEHMLKELNLRKSGLRKPPMRSNTVANYSLLGPGPLVVASSSSIVPPRAQPKFPAQPDIAEESQVSVGNYQLKPSAKNNISAVRQQDRPSLRPALGQPRRSYSVMDYEPVPISQQPSAGLKFTDLPTEIHYAIFDHLDPIDSTCLGLSSKYFYSLHTHFHGTKMSLNSRRLGPNNLEWAWRLAGQLASSNASAGETKKALMNLAAHRIRGPIYCRKCGATRCELHRHLKEWMGDHMEYCAVREKFGAAAVPGAKKYCYRSKPNDPSRCGRHSARRTGTS